MEKARLQAYMNLIRELLLCPNGEEFKILEAHRELLDAKLLEIMEHVAERAEEKGSRGTGIFLRDLGQRLQGQIQGVEAVSDSEISSDYLQLIEALLKCESGLEPEILRSNQDLIDTRLVLRMRQVAGTFAEIGENNASTYLHSIANPLAEALENAASATIAPDYLDLLGELLQAVAKTQGNREIIYPILAAKQEFLDFGFAQALDEWATTTIFASKPDIADTIAEDIIKFSLLIFDFPKGDRECNIEIAIAGFESGLRVFRRDRYPQKWAKLQMQMANAYLNRISGEPAINLEVAIECYRAALEIYEAEDFPQQCAHIHDLLSQVYEKRIHGDKLDNLQTAIAYLRTAFTIVSINP